MPALTLSLSRVDAVSKMTMTSLFLFGLLDSLPWSQSSTHVSVWLATTIFVCDSYATHRRLNSRTSSLRLKSQSVQTWHVVITTNSVKTLSAWQNASTIQRTKRWTPVCSGSRVNSSLSCSVPYANSVTLSRDNKPFNALCWLTLGYRTIYIFIYLFNRYILTGSIKCSDNICKRCKLWVPSLPWCQNP